MIIAAKGGTLADIIVGDVLELLDIETSVLAGWPGDGPVLYQVLHELGIFDDQAPARLRELRTGGQKTPGELIDRYQIEYRPIRDLLVDYLRERQPGLDYNSLRALAYYLGKRFWKDLELHHRGISSLHLPAEVASAWRQRLLTQSRTVATGTGQRAVVCVPRISYGQCLTSVRSFYLDLSQWAIEDPARWAQWVAPCPVSQDQIGNRKFVRRRKARMDARTRERLPVLPVLVRTVDRRRKTTGALLHAAQHADPGHAFTAAGHTLTRSALARSSTTTTTWADDPVTGKRRDLCHEEAYTFWAWAAVEVLRLTGIRIEELLEISHHSLVQYRLPTTGETVPLLQIAPSKTDTERLLVVSPELADVLSVIIRRIREPSGTVPFVPAYDWHECVWMPPAPLLFQRRFRTENRAVSHGTLRKMLQAALADTGLTDAADGSPLNYTPHDFRRLFITDAIMNGLPPHIAQVIAATATLTSPSATRRSTPTRPSRLTWRSWPGGAGCALARNTGLQAMRNGRNSSAISSGGRSQQACAAAPSPPHAYMKTPACGARCTGPTPPSAPAWRRYATTSSPASPRLNAKAGSGRSKDCRSPSPEPRTNSPRSTSAPGPGHQPISARPASPAPLAAPSPPQQ